MLPTFTSRENTIFQQWVQTVEVFHAIVAYDFYRYPIVNQEKVQRTSAFDFQKSFVYGCLYLPLMPHVRIPSAIDLLRWCWKNVELFTSLFPARNDALARAWGCRVCAPEAPGWSAPRRVLFEMASSRRNLFCNAFCVISGKIHATNIFTTSF